MDAAARFQRLTLWGIIDMDTQTRHIAQMSLDLLAQPGVIDHQLIETRLSQRPDVVFDQRHRIVGGSGQ